MDADRPCAGTLENGSGLRCAVLFGTLPRTGPCWSFPQSGAQATTHDPPSSPLPFLASGRRLKGRLMAMSSLSTQLA